MGPSGVRRGRQAAGSHDSGETEKQWRPLRFQLVGTGAAVDTKDLQHSLAFINHSAAQLTSMLTSLAVAFRW